MCGRAEWEKFQEALGNQYQLHVISRDYFNSVVYEGPHQVDKKLYIYHAAEHYSVITSMLAFVERHYYCHTCHVGYNNLGGHVCKKGCKCCQASTTCELQEWKACTACLRYFVSEQCYQHHLASGVCNVVHACKECGQTFHTYNKHVCHKVYCKLCREFQDPTHLCYIRPLNPPVEGVEESEGEEMDEDLGAGAKRKKTKKKPQYFIFYDFECMLGEGNQHIPNLCVVQKVCVKCIELPMGVECGSCKREQLIFRGVNTLQEVGDWLLSGKNRGAICMAHNSQGYDAHLLLDYIHENGVKPTLIENGQKIMSMEVQGLTFIDSLNYFSTSLANMPRIFSIPELHKGYFPHLLNTLGNQQMTPGPMPNKKWYDPESMQPEKRADFDQWYSQQTEFHFQRDLEKYCISDVNILRQCCGKFRKLFMQHAGDIDPFKNSFTIASACNRVYRTLFLKKDTIGIIPPQGYHTDNQSTIAMCWLDWVAKQQNTRIQHAYNGNEKTVEGVKVDGVSEDGTLYKFHGCFYHGCGDCYTDPSTKNAVNGLTMGELRQKTRLKTEMLRDKGHNVIEKWECDFRKDLKEDDELRAFFKSYEPFFPIDPRDPFYGGRTNAILLYCEGNLRYVDFTSLYPWVCKYGIFPLGHPKLYFKEDIPEQVQGLLKCTILPPHQLFHPLLPSHINGKLKFVLCRTCGEEGNQDPCDHTDEERALTGTWVSLEVDKAVSLGYTIIKKYAAWHFDETTQYNAEEGNGGLWAEYINLWLKMKVEASGYPSRCTTQQQKDQYIADYHQHEGIELDSTKIEKNEGLRSLAKLMLNSHWGKFGQNPDKTKVTYVSDPAEYVSMMNDDSIEVTDLKYANKEHVAVRWHTKADFLEALPNTNVVLAAYTTAQARLKLYTLLEKLQDRVVYFDTDSVIYKHDDEQWNPPLGDYLGELKDETGGVPITHFVSGGAKNYAYRTADGKEVCKIRGFTLNCRNALSLNFTSMQELITTPEKRNQKIQIEDPHKIVRKEGHLYSIKQTKDYRVVYDKRSLMEDLSTLPFGWCAEE